MKIEKQVVLNVNYGGFRLSPLAVHNYLVLKGIKGYFYKGFTTPAKRTHPLKLSKDDSFFVMAKDVGDTLTDQNWSKESSFDYSEIDRMDEDLVSVVKELGNQAAGGSSKLEIVPLVIEVFITDFDGKEDVNVHGYRGY